MDDDPLFAGAVDTEARRERGRIVETDDSVDRLFDVFEQVEEIPLRLQQGPVEV